MDEALAILGDSNQHFSSLYAEARGDILLSSGRKSEAISAYQASLDSISEDDVARKSGLEAKVFSLTSGVLATASDSNSESE